jgi:hypothetical protein
MRRYDLENEHCEMIGDIADRVDLQPCRGDPDAGCLEHSEQWECRQVQFNLRLRFDQWSARYSHLG